MSIYYINLALILVLAVPLCLYKPSQIKKALYVALTFGLLIFIASARQDIGNDFNSYITMYHEVGALPLESVWGHSTEPGFALLLKLLFSLGVGDRGMYWVMALLCMLPVAWFIYRYSPNVWLSVWLYVTLTFFYGTMNFVRQNLAVAVLLLGYSLLRKRKLPHALGYVGVILLACTFHKTALFMLPVLLVCYLPLNKPLAMTYASLVVVLYFTSDYIIDFVTQYVYQYYRGSTYFTMGFSYKFLVIPALVLLLVLLLRKPVQTNFETDGAMMVNMMLYSAIIWLFITKHFILERFSLYVYIYVLLAVPMATSCLLPSPQLQKECSDLREQCGTLKKASAKTAQYKTTLDSYKKRLEDLTMRKVYYWCLIAAVLIAALCYHRFGMYDGANGFHGVFPYQSWIPWLERLP